MCASYQRIFPFQVLAWVLVRMHVRFLSLNDTVAEQVTVGHVVSEDTALWMDSCVNKLVCIKVSSLTCKAPVGTCDPLPYTILVSCMSIRY